MNNRYQRLSAEMELLEMKLSGILKMYEDANLKLASVVYEEDCQAELGVDGALQGIDTRFAAMKELLEEEIQRLKAAKQKIHVKSILNLDEVGQAN
ncbi:MAG: hypothetical protein AAFX87_02455 [Bacteroidota bacterium]